jgi:hypothetical protein
MQKAKIILTIFLALAGFGLQGAEIPLQELPKINDFAIVDDEGEQYIAATNGGLYHSHDHGHSWRAHRTGFGLPATMVEATPGGEVYAFVVTLGLLRLDAKTNLWEVVNNRFGSQVRGAESLRQAGRFRQLRRGLAQAARPLPPAIGGGKAGAGHLHRKMPGLPRRRRGWRNLYATGPD